MKLLKLHGFNEDEIYVNFDLIVNFYKTPAETEEIVFKGVSTTTLVQVGSGEVLYVEESPEDIRKLLTDDTYGPTVKEVLDQFYKMGYLNNHYSEKAARILEAL